MSNILSANFYKDWLIADKLNIDNLIQVVNKGTEISVSVPLDYLSISGNYYTKQYSLFKYFKNSSELNSLKEKILLNLNTHLKFKCNKLILQNAWSILSYEHSYHTLHKHNNNKINWITSVIYLAVSKFDDYKYPRDSPGDFYYVYQQDKEIQYNNHKPQIGDLLIFPVWLWHGTYPQAKGLRQTLNLEFEICL